jgi:hypothetical protein
MKIAPFRRLEIVRRGATLPSSGPEISSNTMRKLIFATMTMFLAATCAAAAITPNVGVRFTGPTSAKVVNGFGDTVTFLTGRTTLKRFSFGTLGCFGYGSFPVGVDPYGISIAQLTKSVPLSATGAFKIASTTATYGGADPSLKIKVSVAGQFGSTKSAKGLITLTETGANGGSCGPVKMTFTASTGHVAP